MDKVFALQTWDREFEPHAGHNHDTMIPHMTPVLVGSWTR